MAAMKFWHVTVFERVEAIVDGITKRKMETRFLKKCLTVKEANELFNDKKKEYVGPQFTVLKENF